MLVSTAEPLDRAVALCLRNRGERHGLKDVQTTQVLIRNAKGGDADSFQRLLALYHPRLRARLVRQMDSAMKSHLEPDDILQQVYLDAFRAMDQFRYLGKDSFLRWLFTILDRKLIDEHRAMHAERRDVRREIKTTAASAEDASYVDLIQRLKANSSTASRVLRTRESIGVLQECLDELPEHYRAVIQMRFMQGMPVGDVAKQLRRSVGSIHMICHRALAQLREAFDQHGLTPD